MIALYYMKILYVKTVMYQTLRKWLNFYLLFCLLNPKAISPFFLPFLTTTFYSQLTTFHGIYLFVQKHKFYLLSSEQKTEKSNYFVHIVFCLLKRKSYKQICNINHKQLYCLCQNVFLEKKMNFMLRFHAPKIY